MDEKQKTLIKEVMANAFDQVMEEKLKTVVGDIAAAETKRIVEQMRLDRALIGRDISGLNESTKKAFAEVVKAAAFNQRIDTKANEALIEEQDSRGGYLVSREVADAILRIAASVGLVMSQARKWPLETDELGIPRYTGAFLEGEYLGVDAPGTVTGLSFGQALLIAKKWQLTFVVGNDLLADASVNLADWLLAIGGESLANMIDKQGLVGNGQPFVGVLTNPDVPIFNLASGRVHFSESDAGANDGFKVVEDASDMIGQLEESVLNDAVFVCHRTVWAKLRAQKDTNGNYILPFAGLATPATVAQYPKQGGIRPAGEIHGYPLFTNRHMPAITDDAVSTPFLIFGNFQAFAYGDKGEMRVSQFESGAFGGKEIALADQRAIQYKHRHALVTALPKAFAVAKTAAS